VARCSARCSEAHITPAIKTTLIWFNAKVARLFVAFSTCASAFNKRFIGAIDAVFSIAAIKITHAEGNTIPAKRLIASYAMSRTSIISTEHSLAFLANAGRIRSAVITIRLPAIIVRTMVIVTILTNTRFTTRTFARTTTANPLLTTPSYNFRIEIDRSRCIPCYYTKNIS